jgi:lipopolysaccharide/colanic/teichoic acid biosynthesis glycosyltransferase
MTSTTAAMAPWKRILDLTCIVLSLPLWFLVGLPIVLWIKVVSPGPVFFKQTRVGLGGSLFRLWKFRTMRVNAETQSHEKHLEQLLTGGGNAPMTKLDSTGDARIIRGGRLLRGLGLDELPQLFNVVRGEMSLVGPRPCLPYEFERYEPGQEARVDVAPGLTGYWQVNGKNKTTFREMIEMDIWYTKNVSLSLDLEIMLRTVPALLKQAFEQKAKAAASLTVLVDDDSENLEDLKLENLLLENDQL